MDSAGNAAISGYTGNDTEITIPGTIDGYKVTSVGNDAFMDNKTLVSVSFYENSTCIDMYAFYNCSALKNVYFEEGTMVIPGHLFDETG